MDVNQVVFIHHILEFGGTEHLLPLRTRQVREGIVGGFNSCKPIIKYNVKG